MQGTMSKLHHKVPQTYMRAWCFSGESVHTYDKETKKLLKIGLTKNNIKKIILSNSTDVKEIMVDILLIFIRVINSDLHSMNNVCSAV